MTFSIKESLLERKGQFFVDYSESYGLLQFKKFVLEASTLVQTHYFLFR